MSIFEDILGISEDDVKFIFDLYLFTMVERGKTPEEQSERISIKMVMPTNEIKTRLLEIGQKIRQFEGAKSG